MAVVPRRSMAVPILVVGMLISGSANSLLTKYQEEDDLMSDEEDALVAQRSSTAKPHIQQGQLPMTGIHQVLFLFPAVCDIAGTTLMNVGLILTPVSIYQMSRGALVLWVGILSVMFLGRKLRAYQWASLIIVMLGVALVGLAGSMVKKATVGIPDRDDDAGMVVALLKRMAVATAEMVAPEDPTKVFIGVLLITGAQIFTATQFVIEEKILSIYKVEPLHAVGLEGFWGLSVILLSMPALHYFFAAKSPYFDIPRGWYQIVDHPLVLCLSVAICFSIATFNLCGLGVTKAVSASARLVIWSASRSTIDTCRTLSIWVVSLSLGWEHLSWPFSLLQITGFALLVYGTFVFNGLVRPLIFAPDPEELVELPHEAVLDATAVAPAAQRQGRIGYDVVPIDEERR
ncbi:hypothetical protein QFC22_000553 [Naganishia vaughanmartiniae]|uniref:Uncharacterized protein n=1 Tax=Naganishia vaughanmartiniae TaxID=1424756 RepID=A0ACC2XRG4_9TREE|nr:hypothetical protein QFC22_000553 [Naganishia vaughanmartiniae]